MKNSMRLFLIVVMVVFALTLTGCGDKVKEGAQAPTPAQPKVNMQDGQWEVTVTSEIPGMPAGMAKPHIMTTCLTQKEPIARVKEESDCKMQDMKTIGNTVTWTIVCPNAMSKGTITYAGTSYDGMIESVTKVEGKEMTMKMTMKGKYLGPCPTPPPAPASQK
jgi:uncharacterized lipoprotein YehR (DUF1307 family)